MNKFGIAICLLLEASRIVPGENCFSPGHLLPCYEHLDGDADRETEQLAATVTRFLSYVLEYVELSVVQEDTAAQTDIDRDAMAATLGERGVVLGALVDVLVCHLALPVVILTYGATVVVVGRVSAIALAEAVDTEWLTQLAHLRCDDDGQDDDSDQHQDVGDDRQDDAPQNPVPGSCFVEIVVVVHKEPFGS